MKHMITPRRVDKVRNLLRRRKEDVELLSRYSALSTMASCPGFLEVVPLISYETLRCQVSPYITALFYSAIIGGLDYCLACLFIHCQGISTIRILSYKHVALFGNHFCSYSKGGSCSVLE